MCIPDILFIFGVEELLCVEASRLIMGNSFLRAYLDLLSPMRVGILYEVHRLRFGGELRVLSSLISGFKRQGWHTRLVICSYLDGPTHNEIPGFFETGAEPDSVIHLKRPTGVLSYYRWYFYYRKVGKKFRDCDAVVRLAGYPILSQFIKPKHFCYVQIDAKRIRLPPYLRKSYVKDSNGILLKAYHGLIGKSFRESGTNVEYVAVSKFVKQSVQEIWSYPCNEVIHPPVKLEHFKELSHKNKVASKIVSIGRFNIDKNHTEQLEILSNLVQSQSRDWHLAMIGSTDADSNKILDNLRQIIKENNIGPNVTILENASPDQIDSELSTAQYFLHTNHKEGYPISVVEGMAAGCIPIIPGGTGQAEIVTNELQFSSVSEAADILKRLLTGWKPSSILLGELDSDEKIFQKRWVDLIRNSVQE